MTKFLVRPLTLLFIGLYIVFIFFLLSGFRDQDLDDFPWGNIYLEKTNGKLSELGVVSYHFNSQEDSYISYENFDHFKEGFYFENQDGLSPKKIKFTDFKYNKFFRRLSAVCDFQSNADGYLNTHYDYYIYENKYGFSRASGYQLSLDSYDDLFPFYFPNGAVLIIEACSINHSDEIPTDIFIRFEKDQYPQNEPSYETDTIKVNSVMSTYEILIPKSLPGLGYSSVLMYVENINTSLIIKDVTLKFFEDGKEYIHKLIFSDAFGSAIIIEPYSYKDLKWEYEFKFSNDFKEIKGGYLEIHSEGSDPWRTNYGPDWHYIKSN